MALNLENLSTDIRNFMDEELQYDIDNQNLSISSRLNKHGKSNYVSMMKKAIKRGSDGTLANDILVNHFLRDVEEIRSGDHAVVSKIPGNANILIAETEFNKYYVRALCRKAIKDERIKLEIYIAKEVLIEKSSIEKMLRNEVFPYSLIKKLRDNIRVDVALGFPKELNLPVSLRIK
jgi:hypothetical protein